MSQSNASCWVRDCEKPAAGSLRLLMPTMLSPEGQLVDVELCERHLREKTATLRAREPHIG